MGSDGNEIGVLGSLNKSFAVAEDSKLNFLAEAAWFRNFEGGADNALVMTGSAAYQTGPMTYSIAYSQQRNLVTAGADTTEHLFDASMMYDLGDTASVAGEKWSLGAGYSFARVDDETVQTVGLKLTSEFGGSASLAN